MGPEALEATPGTCNVAGVSTSREIHRSKGVERLLAHMNVRLPKLTDPSGLFDYLITLILVIVLFFGIVLYLGLGPF